MAPFGAIKPRSEGWFDEEVKKRGGTVFFPHMHVWSPATPLGLVCPLRTRTQTGQVGMTGPEADSKLVAKLGNRRIIQGEVQGHSVGC